MRIKWKCLDGAALPDEGHTLIHDDGHQVRLTARERLKRTPVSELRAAVADEVLLQGLTHNLGLPLTQRSCQVL